MTEKIHCDLLALYGPGWENLPTDKVTLLAESVDKLPKMLGNEHEFFGFVGTRRIANDIVAGYFAIQYSNEEFLYSRNKKLNKETHTPFARLFFVLFARTGKVLLQNSKFAGIPLSMQRALSLFKQAIDHVLMENGIQKTFNIDLVPEETTEADFIREFERSTRVTRIHVNYPNGGIIPDEFVYYNPQKERNSIIRESHKHDYDDIKKVDLEATDDGDLKRTHLRDLIYVGRPQEMRYYVEFQQFTLRKTIKRKYEFHVDMDAEQVPLEHVIAVVETLKRERAVDMPTKLPPPDSNPNQPELFDSLYSNEDDEDTSNEE